MVQIFTEHIDAKEVELQLQTIAETTLLPALKAKRGDDGSTAQIDQAPPPPVSEQVQDDSIAPDRASGRRALQSEGGPRRRGSPPKSSAEWLDHCRGKYTSFNPQTGKYRSYSGVYRPCR